MHKVFINLISSVRTFTLIKLWLLIDSVASAGTIVTKFMHTWSWLKLTLKLNFECWQFDYIWLQQPLMSPLVTKQLLWPHLPFSLYTFLIQIHNMNISSPVILCISTHFYMSAGISYELSYETVSSHLSPPTCPITDGENKECNIMTYTGGAVRGNLLSMGDIIIHIEGISRDPQC